MLNLPSRRRKKLTKFERINLTSIMDAVFIFVFFLLMSANFSSIFEQSSDVPIVSDTPPPPNQKPLALTLRVLKDKIIVLAGVPLAELKEIPNLPSTDPLKPEGTHDTETLHAFLIETKKQYMGEDSLILEPAEEVSYESIVLIIDSARLMRKTDEALYKVNDQGLEQKLELLFSSVVFGNIQS